MKTKTLASILAGFLLGIGFNLMATNSGQEPQPKNQTKCIETKSKANNGFHEFSYKVFYDYPVFENDMMIAKTEKTGSSDSPKKTEEPLKTKPQTKVNQPIIGGFLGMILFEPNFLNTNLTTNPDKG